MHGNENRSSALRTQQNRLGGGSAPDPAATAEGGCPLPIPYPSRRLRRLDPQTIPALFSFHFEPWISLEFDIEFDHETADTTLDV